MSKVCIITDSNSGITQSESKELGIVVIPMPFYINEVQHFEDIDMTQEEFYEALMDEKTEVSTSQPSPDTIMQTWRENLEEYDEIVHIPMSSGISSSCATAMMLAQEEEFEGKVFVVDNQRISVTQRRSVQQAKELAERGYSAKEIHDILFRDKFQSSIYIMVNTLKYLRKGGRLTPAVAAIGTVLRIKPVLQIQGEKLDAYSKARGKNRAKAIMIDAAKKDLSERFAQAVKDGKVIILASEIGTTATGSVIGSLYLAKVFYPEEFKDIDLTKVHEEFQETLFNSELTGIYAYPEVN